MNESDSDNSDTDKINVKNNFIDDDADDDSDVSIDSETRRKKQRLKRKHPRSKVQQYVDDAVDNIKLTTELNLSRYNAIRFTSRIYDLHNLIILNLSYNRLQFISPNIQYLINLTNLDVSHNEIRGLPKEMEELTKLTELNIGFNKIKTYQGTFYKLHKMKRLNLSNNKFPTIPIETGNLELLRELGKWDIGIALMDKLLSLDVSNCRLTDWPLQLESLLLLEYLDLSYNQLVTIPSEVSELKSLKSLKITHNKLESFSYDLFYLEAIEEIYLNNNNIIEFPLLNNANQSNENVTSNHDELLEEHDNNNNNNNSNSSPILSHLSIIDLSYNKLISLNSSLSIFQTVSKFICHHNQLSMIDSYAISTCKLLSYVDLSHNQLKLLPNEFNSFNKQYDPIYKHEIKKNKIDEEMDENEKEPDKFNLKMKNILNAKKAKNNNNNSNPLGSDSMKLNNNNLNDNIILSKKEQKIMKKRAKILLLTRNVLTWHNKLTDYFILHNLFISNDTESNPNNQLINVNAALPFPASANNSNSNSNNNVNNNNNNDNNNNYNYSKHVYDDKINILYQKESYRMNIFVTSVINKLSLSTYGNEYKYLLPIPKYNNPFQTLLNNNELLNDNIIEILENLDYGNELEEVLYPLLELAHEIHFLSSSHEISSSIYNDNNQKILNNNYDNHSNNNDNNSDNPLIHRNNSNDSFVSIDNKSTISLILTDNNNMNNSNNNSLNNSIDQQSNSNNSIDKKGSFGFGKMFGSKSTNKESEKEKNGDQTSSSLGGLFSGFGIINNKKNSNSLDNQLINDNKLNQLNENEIKNYNNNHILLNYKSKVVVFDSIPNIIQYHRIENAKVDTLLYDNPLLCNDMNDNNNPVIGNYESLFEVYYQLSKLLLKRSELLRNNIRRIEKRTESGISSIFPLSQRADDDYMDIIHDTYQEVYKLVNSKKSILNKKPKKNDSIYETTPDDIFDSELVNEDNQELAEDNNIVQNDNKTSSNDLHVNEISSTDAGDISDSAVIINDGIKSDEINLVGSERGVIVDENQQNNNDNGILKDNDNNNNKSNNIDAHNINNDDSKLNNADIKENEDQLNLNFLNHNMSGDNNNNTEGNVKKQKNYPIEKRTSSTIEGVQLLVDTILPYNIRDLEIIAPIHSITAAKDIINYLNHLRSSSLLYTYILLDSLNNMFKSFGLDIHGSFVVFRKIYRSMVLKNPDNYWMRDAINRTIALYAKVLQYLQLYDLSIKSYNILLQLLDSKLNNSNSSSDDNNEKLIDLNKDDSPWSLKMISLEIIKMLISKGDFQLARIESLKLYKKLQGIPLDDISEEGTVPEDSLDWIIVDKQLGLYYHFIRENLHELVTHNCFTLRDRQIYHMQHNGQLLITKPNLINSNAPDILYGRNIDDYKKVEEMETLRLKTEIAFNLEQKRNEYKVLLKNSKLKFTELLNKKY
eukprot:gene4179-5947_t